MCEVVQPTTADEMAELLRSAQSKGTKVAVRGGRTWGRLLPDEEAAPDILLDLSRMNRIRSIEQGNLLARVEAGVVTAAVGAAIADEGLFYPPDPTSLESSTIGGNVACAAAGPRQLKYGGTRDFVMRLEVVLPNGERIRTGANMQKSVAGYDMTRFLTGSGARFGVVTGAILRLLPRPQYREIVLCSFPSASAVASTAQAVIKSGMTPAAIELLDSRCIEVDRDAWAALGMAQRPAGVAESLLLFELDGVEASVVGQRVQIERLCAQQGGAEVVILSDPNASTKALKLRQRLLSRLTAAYPLWAMAKVAVAPRQLPLMTRFVRNLVFRHLLPYQARLRFFRMLMRRMERLGLFALAGRIVSGRLREALRLLPDLSAPPFVPGDVAATASQNARHGTVALFWGCIAPVLLPNVQQATVTTLRSYGYEVVVPEGQTCCGALHLHHGLRDDAQALARQNLAVFDGAGYDTIIANAAGCGAALKGYPELLRGTSEEGCANRFRRRVNDLAEFLACLPSHPESAFLKETVTCQDPCHLAHGQGVRNEPRQILKATPGLELKEMPEAERCCGSAGIYHLLHPEMSRRLRQTKIDHVAATGARIVVTANPWCQLYLQAGIREQGLDLEVLHLAELLARAYGTRPGE